MSLSKPSFAGAVSEYAVFAQRLADAARAQTLPRFRADGAVFNKAGLWYDPVTDADREAERVVSEMVERVYPRHGFIGEEFGERSCGDPLCWIVDPVDGTRAFVTGSPTWATLIALEHEGESILGLIDQPYTDERWVAFDGAAEFLHAGKQKICNTSRQTDLSKARIATTDPRAQGCFSDTEAAAFFRLSQATRLARFSMDAYAYGLLALGQIDIVAEAGLQHHDFAALAPVVRAAGGVITDWRGEPINAGGDGRVLAAATPELHEAALEALAL